MQKSNFLDKLVCSLEKRLMDYGNYEYITRENDYKNNFAGLYFLRKYENGEKVLLYFHIEKNNGWVEEEKAKIKIKETVDYFQKKRTKVFFGFRKIHWFYVLGLKDEIYKIKRTAIMERIE